MEDSITILLDLLIYTYLVNILNISSIKYSAREQCYNKFGTLYGDILALNREDFKFQIYVV